MEALSPQEQAELLEQQLEDMEDGVGTNPFWMGGNEPWDLWQENNVPQDDNNQNLFQVDPNKGKVRVYVYDSIITIFVGWRLGHW